MSTKEHQKDCSGQQETLIFINNYFNDLYSLYIYLIIISFIHTFRANCIKYYTMMKNADCNFPEPGDKISGLTWAQTGQFVFIYLITL